MSKISSKLGYINGTLTPKELLGKGRAKLGMFEGDVDHGELEIGQISGLIKKIKPAAQILIEIIKDFEMAKKEFC
jgi:enoyl-[acyl-carrier protein] reductase II